MLVAVDPDQDCPGIAIRRLLGLTWRRLNTHITLGGRRARGQENGEGCQEHQDALDASHRCSLNGARQNGTEV